MVRGILALGVLGWTVHSRGLREFKGKQATSKKVDSASAVYRVQMHAQVLGTVLTYVCFLFSET